MPPSAGRAPIRSAPGSSAAPPLQRRAPRDRAPVRSGKLALRREPAPHAGRPPREGEPFAPRERQPGSAVRAPMGPAPDHGGRAPRPPPAARRDPERPRAVAPRGDRRRGRAPQPGAGRATLRGGPRQVWVLRPVSEAAGGQAGLAARSAPRRRGRPAGAARGLRQVAAASPLRSRQTVRPRIRKGGPGETGLEDPGGGEAAVGLPASLAMLVANRPSKAPADRARWNAGPQPGPPRTRRWDKARQPARRDWGRCAPPPARSLGPRREDGVRLAHLADQGTRTSAARDGRAAEARGARSVGFRLQVQRHSDPGSDLERVPHRSAARLGADAPRGPPPSPRPPFRGPAAFLSSGGEGPQAGPGCGPGPGGRAAAGRAHSPDPGG